MAVPSARKERTPFTPSNGSLPTARPLAAWLGWDGYLEGSIDLNAE